MAVFNLENNNKWGAASVYDMTLQKSQEEINSEADTALQPDQVDTPTINALAALIVPANDGKVIGVANGALAAVSGGADVDATLSIAGKAADAKATGDAVGELKSALDKNVKELESDINYLEQIKPSLNLFNYRDAVQGYTIDSNNTIVPGASTDYISSYIPVEYGQSYIVGFYNTSANAYGAGATPKKLLVDADYNVIAAVSRSFTITNAAIKYLIFSITTDGIYSYALETTGVFRGLTYPSVRIDYGKIRSFNDNVLQQGVLIPYPGAFASRVKPNIYRGKLGYYTDLKPETFKISSSSTCYLSVGGDDTTGDGTYKKPYKTLEKALTEADTIIILPGKYIEGTNFTHGVNISGKNIIAYIAGTVFFDSGASTCPNIVGNAYIEGIDFSNGTSALRVAITDSDTVCLNRCIFHDCTSSNCLSVLGGNIYVLNCEAYNAIRDGFNYHKNSDISIPNVFEYNCVGHDCGASQNNNSCNGSTIHDGSKIVRVNCEFYNCHGGVVADKGQDATHISQSFNVNVCSHESTYSMETDLQFDSCFWVNDYCDSWLLDCIAYGSLYDISAYHNANVYSQNLISENAFTPSDYTDASGTIVRI